MWGSDSLEPREHSSMNLQRNEYIFVPFCVFILFFQRAKYFMCLECNSEANCRDVKHTNCGSHRDVSLDLLSRQCIVGELGLADGLHFLHLLVSQKSKKLCFFLVVIYECELGHKDGWVPKNWCFWTEVLEETPESPLDCKKIKPVNLKGNQPWLFIGRTDAEAEAPVLWLPEEQSWLIAKDPDAGKVRR